MTKKEFLAEYGLSHGWTKAPSDDPIKVPMKNFSRNLIAALIGVFISFLLLEVLCQAFFIFVVAKDLEAKRNNPLHYYTASDDPALRYVLKPGYWIEKDGRKIVINGLGIRDDSDSTAYLRKVALLGPAVPLLPFGIRLSQEDTPPAVLQRLAGESIKVLNFGVPGYGLEEIQRFLEIKYPIYKPQQIFYILIPTTSPAATPSTRVLKQPVAYIGPRFFKLPFFVGKAIYHFMQGGVWSSVRWYLWMYEGGKKKGLPIIKNRRITRRSTAVSSPLSCSRRALPTKITATFLAGRVR